MLFLFLFFSLFVEKVYVWHCMIMTNYIFLTSATSVDVEEHLYKVAKSMGITVVTSSQVGGFSFLIFY